jgi:hypothetical protein
MEGQAQAHDARAFQGGFKDQVQHGVNEARCLTFWPSASCRYTPAEVSGSHESTGSVVELPGDGVEVILGVPGQVSALGQVSRRSPLVFSLLSRSQGQCGSARNIVTHQFVFDALMMLFDADAHRNTDVWLLSYEKS